MIRLVRFDSSRPLPYRPKLRTHPRASQSHSANRLVLNETTVPWEILWNELVIDRPYLGVGLRVTLD